MEALEKHDKDAKEAADAAKAKFTGIMGGFKNPGDAAKDM